jgi:hypothetical protein
MLRRGRERSNDRTLGRRAFRGALVVMLAAAVGGGLLAAPADAIFRAFSPSSPWNQTAVAVDESNPWASQFGDHPGLPMRISGTPDNPTYAAPVFFAQRGDPVAPVFVTQPDWLPDGDTGWNRKPIPVPSGVRPAPGADGHLTVVSADRRTAWDFFGCTGAGTNGYVTRVIVQWNLGGPGYSAQNNETSARGSGTPLISTSLRAEEAIKGFQHALGISVPRVSSEYVTPPATHSDGKQGPTGLKYGMRFVLRPDYPVQANASIGVLNVIYGLKVYGVFVVDQGADFEIDADSTHVSLWQQAGISAKTFGFTATDFRPAVPGTPAQIPTIVTPAQQSSWPDRISLHGNRRKVRLGRRIHLFGKVRADLIGDERVEFEALTRGRWRHLMESRVKGGGKFNATTRLYRVVRQARGGRSKRTLKVRRLHLGNVRKLRVRAVVSRVGRSDVVVLHFRH